MSLMYDALKQDDNGNLESKPLPKAFDFQQHNVQLISKWNLALSGFILLVVGFIGYLLFQNPAILSSPVKAPPQQNTYVAAANKPPVSITKATEPVAITKATEPVAITKATEPVAITKATEPVAITKATEPVTTLPPTKTLTNPRAHIQKIKYLVTQLKNTIQNENIPKTTELLQQLAQKAGKDSIVTLRMNGYWSLQQNLNQESRQFYQQLLMLQPNDLEANMNMALLDVRLGNMDNAKNRLNKMTVLYPDSNSVKQFSKSLYSMGLQ
ncbi:MAG: Flp pilus assembly protein TadD [Congregibacter sp.]|jgi:Flp pilus assembly protein TadD